MPARDFSWFTLLEGPFSLSGAAGPTRELPEPVPSSYHLYYVVGLIFFF